MKRFLLIFAFVLFWSQSAFASFTFKGTDNNGATVDTVTVNYSGAAVSSGDLILVWAAWQSNVGAASVSDGTTSFTAGTLVRAGNSTQENGQWFYLLSSVATGNPSYTLTVTGSGFPAIIMYVFSHTGTVTADSHGEDWDTGGSTSLDTASFTAAAGDTIVFGGASQKNNNSFSSQAIGGSSATTNQVSGGIGPMTVGIWYLVKTGSVTATATSSAADPWVCGAISFNIASTATSRNLTLLGVGQ